MTSVSHHTTKELVMALRNAAPYSKTPDLMMEAADRLDPMQELADLWRADEQAAEIERLREKLLADPWMMGPHAWKIHTREWRREG